MLGVNIVLASSVFIAKGKMTVEMTASKYSQKIEKNRR